MEEKYQIIKIYDSSFLENIHLETHQFYSYTVDMNCTVEGAISALRPFLLLIFMEHKEEEKYMKFNESSVCVQWP